MLAAGQSIGIGMAVAAHLLACFASEAAIDAEIAAGTITTTEQVDWIRGGRRLRSRSRATQMQGPGWPRTRR